LQKRRLVALHWALLPLRVVPGAAGKGMNSSDRCMGAQESFCW